jgi:hypothetical protein
MIEMDAQLLEVFMKKEETELGQGSIPSSILIV